MRALIRAALNERALERYISTWLSDTTGLNTYFESWALIRDNEATNLLPSIAAGLYKFNYPVNFKRCNHFCYNNFDNLSLFLLCIGLGSILFAVTVDSPELNVSTPAESTSPRQMNEIIIAVPTVSSISTERKPTASKKKAIISFDEDENSSIVNNNIFKSATPPTNVSLADACLKYQEKQKLTENKSKIITDSTYERIHAEPINVSSTVHPSETDFIEPESPTAITIINPMTQTYQSLSNSFDYKETDSSISKADSSSITSSTTTHSSTSPRNRIPTQASHSTSMSSSISSEHSLRNSVPNIASSPENVNDIEQDIENENEPPTENDYLARIEHLKMVENQQISRIQILETRCSQLENRVSALTM